MINLNTFLSLLENKRFILFARDMLAGILIGTFLYHKDEQILTLEERYEEARNQYISKKGD